MKALISPNEQRETGYRVAEVHATGFEVAQPLFWVDCADDLDVNTTWFDPSDNSFKSIPEPVVLNASSNQAQPTVDGAEQL